MGKNQCGDAALGGDASESSMEANILRKWCRHADGADSLIKNQLQPAT